MILFFIGFSVIRSYKDFIFFIKIIVATCVAIVVYAFGQRYYIYIWNLLPAVFEKFPFCFPSFQTGNEEFAKGVPLCLPFDARITSTFAGHYDLGAYMVMLIPVMVGLLLSAQRMITRAGYALLSVGMFIALLFTASRVSYAAYLVSIILTLIFMRQKKWIVPVVLGSVALLFVFSGSTANRFAQTLRTTEVVTNNQGQVVGYTKDSLPEDLKRLISEQPVNAPVAPPSQALPVGSGFITLPSADRNVEKTDVAVVEKSLTREEAERMSFEYGGVELSTVEGNFTIRQVLVWDISFTTRIQGEWPYAWAAFMRNPALGSGYGTITLATDNSVLRALGETGILGLGSFLFVFVMLYVVARKILSVVEDQRLRYVTYGMIAGVGGLFINASLIDVFEASKVAESLWLMLGIITGALLIGREHALRYWGVLKGVVSSYLFIAIVTGIVVLALFLGHTSNFFAGDDTTWLRWAASATLPDILNYFTHASGFFYRPLDKLLMVVYFAFFGFSPGGYHMMALATHFLMIWGVFLLGMRLFDRKMMPALLAAALFLLSPVHVENVFWLSTISVNTASLAILYGVLCYLNAREKNSLVWYVGCLILTGIALLSYEMAVITVILYILCDWIVLSTRINLRHVIRWYVPVVALTAGYLILRTYSGAHIQGGDYSYNLLKLLPNTVGNTLGYVLMFFFGIESQRFVGWLRSLLAGHWVLTSIVLGVVSVWIVWRWSRRIFVWLRSPRSMAGAFGILFALVALLPFVGFGNTAPRYAYLASVGCAFAAAWYIQQMWKQLWQKASVIIVCLIYLIFSVNHIAQAGKEWNLAGKITQNTLGFFKATHLQLNREDTIIVINHPIRTGNAWVFPVGIDDGLWFVYREELPKLVYVASVEEAKLVPVNEGKRVMVQFTDRGEIQEVAP
jgi:hypothetical protein